MRGRRGDRIRGKRLLDTDHHVQRSDRGVGAVRTFGGIMRSTGFFINLHKALVIPVVVAAMLIFGNFSTVMWLYLAMHGTYSILWLI
jgi:hypothetical protein